MNITALLAWLETSNLAEAIRTSAYLFGLIESFHVSGMTLVFGTSTVVDLRLLGVASTRRPFTKLASETLKWTWAAFALSAVTGSLLFITNAQVYYHNFFFRSKMILLAFSGLNMLIFKFTAEQTGHRWDKDQVPPLAARTVGLISIVLWIAILVFEIH